jgi:hypothetical protein
MARDVTFRSVVGRDADVPRKVTVKTMAQYIGQRRTFLGRIELEQRDDELIKN